VKRFWRLPALLALFTPCLPAHVISMSTGWATVDGNRVEYILRMPKYEMPAGGDPAQALFNNIVFSSGFETGIRTSQECHADPASADYLCAANYRFSAPVRSLGVECEFYRVTVPNHIHMLHAERAGKSDQAILDATFPSATLAFRPPTPAEVLIRQSGAAAFGVWSNPAQLLLLLAVALASRNRRELLVSGFAFLFGESAGTLAILHSGWQPSPRFAEAATALALAYLALEIVVFPESRGRWLLALFFGAFEGMFFALFVFDSGYLPAYVIAGAAIAGSLVLAAAFLCGTVIPPRYHRVPATVAAVALLAIGSTWFVVRLRG